MSVGVPGPGPVRPRGGPEAWKHVHTRVPAERGAVWTPCPGAPDGPRFPSLRDRGGGGDGSDPGRAATGVFAPRRASWVQVAGLSHAAGQSFRFLWDSVQVQPGTWRFAGPRSRVALSLLSRTIWARSGRVFRKNYTARVPSGPRGPCLNPIDRPSFLLRPKSRIVISRGICNLGPLSATRGASSAHAGAAIPGGRVGTALLTEVCECTDFTHSNR